MSWRVVVVTGIAKLDYKMGYLVIRDKDGSKRIHLSEIGTLMLESTAISLTAYLICELSKQKINVIFCDEKRLPAGMYMPFYGSHDTALKYRRQIGWDPAVAAVVWKHIVAHKILGQSAVLRYLDKGGCDLLDSYLPQVQPMDATNREGHAAKVYFNSLFGMDFTRDADTPTNAALNYGYSILLSAVAREIVSCGYATQIGIFHDNVFNQLNLASDIMEPFRPFVDLLVYRLRPEVFERPQKLKLANLLNRQIYHQGKLQYISNALRLYAKSVLDAMSDGEPDTIKFPDYELSIYESDGVL